MSASIIPDSINLPDLTEKIVKIAVSVGEKVCGYYERYLRNDSLQVDHKSDRSPVTEVDLFSHQMLEKQLQSLLPELPLISEEVDASPLAIRQTWQRFWMIDPLDGTREFLHKQNEFTINIALIENNEAVIGVICVPIAGECYLAYRGGGAFKQSKDQTRKKLTTRQFDSNHFRILASRFHASNHLHEFLQKLPHHEVIHAGSALKFCWLAEGKADMYPRLSPTSEWDTAAGQCIVEEAGGQIVDMQFNRLRYNAHEDLLNPSFIAIADPGYDWSSVFNAK